MCGYSAITTNIAQQYSIIISIYTHIYGCVGTKPMPNRIEPRVPQYRYVCATVTIGTAKRICNGNSTSISETKIYWYGSENILQQRHRSRVLIYKHRSIGASLFCCVSIVCWMADIKVIMIIIEYERQRQPIKKRKKVTRSTRTSRKMKLRESMFFCGCSAMHQRTYI